MNVDYPRRGSSSDNNKNTSLRVPAPPDADLSGLETELEGDTNSENESDEGIDLGVIKIISDDPMAAARAAAILKMVRLLSLFLNKNFIFKYLYCFLYLTFKSTTMTCCQRR